MIACWTQRVIWIGLLATLKHVFVAAERPRRHGDLSSNLLERRVAADGNPQRARRHQAIGQNQDFSNVVKTASLVAEEEISKPLPPDNELAKHLIAFNRFPGNGMDQQHLLAVYQAPLNDELARLKIVRKALPGNGMDLQHSQVLNQKVCSSWSDAWSGCFWDREPNQHRATFIVDGQTSGTLTISNPSSHDWEGTGTWNMNTISFKGLKGQLVKSPNGATLIDWSNTVTWQRCDTCPTLPQTSYSYADRQNPGTLRGEQVAEEDLADEIKGLVTRLNLAHESANRLHYWKEQACSSWSTAWSGCFWDREPNQHRATFTVTGQTSGFLTISNPSSRDWEGTGTWSMNTIRFNGLTGELVKSPTGATLIEWSNKVTWQRCDTCPTLPQTSDNYADWQHLGTLHGEQVAEEDLADETKGLVTRLDLAHESVKRLHYWKDQAHLGTSPPVYRYKRGERPVWITKPNDGHCEQALDLKCQFFNCPGQGHETECDKKNICKCKDKHACVVDGECVSQPPVRWTFNVYDLFPQQMADDTCQEKICSIFMNIIAASFQADLEIMTCKTQTKELAISQGKDPFTQVVIDGIKPLSHTLPQLKILLESEKPGREALANMVDQIRSNSFLMHKASASGDKGKIQIGMAHVGPPEEEAREVFECPSLFGDKSCSEEDHGECSGLGMRCNIVERFCECIEGFCVRQGKCDKSKRRALIIISLYDVNYANLVGKDQDQIESAVVETIKSLITYMNDDDVGIRVRIQHTTPVTAVADCDIPTRNKFADFLRHFEHIGKSRDFQANFRSRLQLNNKLTSWIMDDGTGNRLVDVSVPVVIPVLDVVEEERWNSDCVTQSDTLCPYYNDSQRRDDIECEAIGAVCKQGICTCEENACFKNGDKCVKKETAYSMHFEINHLPFDKLTLEGQREVKAVLRNCLKRMFLEKGVSDVDSMKVVVGPEAKVRITFRTETVHIDLRSKLEGAASTQDQCAKDLDQLPLVASARKAMGELDSRGELNLSPFTLDLARAEVAVPQQKVFPQLDQEALDKAEAELKSAMESRSAFKLAAVINNIKGRELAANPANLQNAEALLKRIHETEMNKPKTLARIPSGATSRVSADDSGRQKLNAEATAKLDELRTELMTELGTVGSIDDLQNTISKVDLYVRKYDGEENPALRNLKAKLEEAELALTRMKTNTKATKEKAAELSHLMLKEVNVLRSTITTDSDTLDHVTDQETLVKAEAILNNLQQATPLKTATSVTLEKWIQKAASFSRNLGYWRQGAEIRKHLRTGLDVTSLRDAIAEARVYLGIVHSEEDYSELGERLQLLRDQVQELLNKAEIELENKAAMKLQKLVREQSIAKARLTADQQQEAEQITAELTGLIRAEKVNIQKLGAGESQLILDKANAELDKLQQAIATLNSATSDEFDSAIQRAKLLEKKIKLWNVQLKQWIKGTNIRTNLMARLNEGSNGEIASLQEAVREAQEYLNGDHTVDSELKEQLRLLREQVRQLTNEAASQIQQLQRARRSSPDQDVKPSTGAALARLQSAETLGELEIAITDDAGSLGSKVQAWRELASYWKKAEEHIDKLATIFKTAADIGKFRLAVENADAYVKAVEDKHGIPKSRAFQKVLSRLKTELQKAQSKLQQEEMSSPDDVASGEKEDVRSSTGDEKAMALTGLRLAKEPAELEGANLAEAERLGIAVQPWSELASYWRRAEEQTNKLATILTQDADMCSLLRAIQNTKAYLNEVESISEIPKNDAFQKTMVELQRQLKSAESQLQQKDVGTSTGEKMQEALTLLKSAENEVALRKAILLNAKTLCIETGPWYRLATSWGIAVEYSKALAHELETDAGIASLQEAIKQAKGFLIVLGQSEVPENDAFNQLLDQLRKQLQIAQQKEQEKLAQDNVEDVELSAGTLNKLTKAEALAGLTSALTPRALEEQADKILALKKRQTLAKGEPLGIDVAPWYELANYWRQAKARQEELTNILQTLQTDPEIGDLLGVIQEAELSLEEIHQFTITHEGTKNDAFEEDLNFLRRQLQAAELQKKMKEEQMPNVEPGGPSKKQKQHAPVALEETLQTVQGLNNGLLTELQTDADIGNLRSAIENARLYLDGHRSKISSRTAFGEQLKQLQGRYWTAASRLMKHVNWKLTVHSECTPKTEPKDLWADSEQKCKIAASAVDECKYVEFTLVGPGATTRCTCMRECPKTQRKEGTNLHSRQAMQETQKVEQHQALPSTPADRMVWRLLAGGYKCKHETTALISLHQTDSEADSDDACMAKASKFDTCEYLKFDRTQIPMVCSCLQTCTNFVEANKIDIYKRRPKDLQKTISKVQNSKEKLEAGSQEGGTIDSLLSAIQEARRLLRHLEAVVQKEQADPIDLYLPISRKDKNKQIHILLEQKGDNEWLVVDKVNYYRKKNIRNRNKDNSRPGPKIHDKIDGPNYGNWVQVQMEGEDEKQLKDLEVTLEVAEIRLELKRIKGLRKTLVDASDSNDIQTLRLAIENARAYRPEKQHLDKKLSQDVSSLDEPELGLKREWGELSKLVEASEPQLQKLKRADAFDRLKNAENGQDLETRIGEAGEYLSVEDLKPYSILAVQWLQGPASEEDNERFRELLQKYGAWKLFKSKAGCVTSASDKRLGQNNIMNCMVDAFDKNCNYFGFHGAATGPSRVRVEEEKRDGWCTYCYEECKIIPAETEEGYEDYKIYQFVQTAEAEEEALARLKSATTPQELEDAITTGISLGIDVAPWRGQKLLWGEARQKTSDLTNKLETSAAIDSNSLKLAIKSAEDYLETVADERKKLNGIGLRFENEGFQNELKQLRTALSRLQQVGKELRSKEDASRAPQKQQSTDSAEDSFNSSSEGRGAGTTEDEPHKESPKRAKHTSEDTIYIEAKRGTFFSNPSTSQLLADAPCGTPNYGDLPLCSSAKPGGYCYYTSIADFRRTGDNSRFTTWTCCAGADGQPPVCGQNVILWTIQACPDTVLLHKFNYACCPHMGVYVMTGDNHDGRPVYKHSKGTHYLSYWHEYREWRVIGGDVWTENPQAATYLMKSNHGTQLLCPTDVTKWYRHAEEADVSIKCEEPPPYEIFCDRCESNLIDCNGDGTVKSLRDCVLGRSDTGCDEACDASRWDRNQCEDHHEDCATSSKACNEANVKSQCPKTCGVACT